MAAWSGAIRAVMSRRPFPIRQTRRFRCIGSAAGLLADQRTVFRRRGCPRRRRHRRILDRPGIEAPAVCERRSRGCARRLREESGHPRGPAAVSRGRGTWRRCGPGGDGSNRPGRGDPVGDSRPAQRFDELDQAADVAPTANILAAVNGARASAARVMAKWNALRTIELPALNARLKAAGVSEIE
jgi:hypothetical protein